MITTREAAERVVLAALERYGHTSAPDLEFVKYRENWVFRLGSGPGSYAVRVHRRGYRTDAELQEELDLIHALAKAGAAVPVLRPTVSGEQFCHVPDGDGDVYQVDMLAWVDGASPLGDIVEAFEGRSVIDRGVFRELGALIGRLHEITSRLPELKTSVRAAWDCEGLTGPSPVWGDPLRSFEPGDADRAVVADAIDTLAVQLRDYGTSADRFGPIHADMTPENVLVDGAGEMTIIDFDDSGHGYYLFDIATAAFFYLPHPEGDTVVSELLAGYVSVRSLTSADEAMWRHMLLARGLTYIGWAADRPGDEVSDYILETVRPFVVELARELSAIEAER